MGLRKLSSKRRSGRKLSTIPPPKPPRTDLTVLREIQQNHQEKIINDTIDEVEKQIVIFIYLHKNKIFRFI